MSTRKPQRGARSKPSNPARLDYVEETKGAGGQTYLYYRRAGRRIPLPQPEGGTAFLLAYGQAKLAVEGGPSAPSASRLTVRGAITAYLKSADYLTLDPGTQEDYRRTLGRFRDAFGALHMGVLDEAWVDELRDKYAARPIAWNDLRSRMVMVVRRWRKDNPGVLPTNPWEGSGRLAVAKSDQNRPWPPGILRQVFVAATPEFRALLVCYLLTVQRGSDATAFSPEQYDPGARTLRLTQKKTDEDQLLHVPESLARVFDSMRGRHPKRLLVTPRGQPWTTGNAQETLARLRKQLGIGRYTLHGLRATGPVALKMLGFENRPIRALSGHTSDANLETYLRGVDHYPLARVAQEALEETFGPLLAEAEKDDATNARKFSGVTGRAAAKAKREKPSKDGG